ncbi:hypothetical protein JCM19241_4659 [Vibrio ishigakensis]|uniref:Uncharacterized protein n=1 Tax=Vibrio ishigakensis TaxID=1481914 RepID=A0A0B8QFZ9_9VIBR|nr:hypothetical protein JCM19241_4659 [Vibrio ishigakensis]
MYKLIIPALLTASLVGCGGDDGASQVTQDHNPNSGLEQPSNPNGLNPGSELGKDEIAPQGRDEWKNKVPLAVVKPTSNKPSLEEIVLKSKHKPAGEMRIPQETPILEPGEDMKYPQETPMLTPDSSAWKYDPATQVVPKPVGDIASSSDTRKNKAPVVKPTSDKPSLKDIVLKSKHKPAGEMRTPQETPILEPGDDMKIPQETPILEPGEDMKYPQETPMLAPDSSAWNYDPATQVVPKPVGDIASSSDTRKNKAPVVKPTSDKPSLKDIVLKSKHKPAGEMRTPQETPILEPGDDMKIPQETPILEPGDDMKIPQETPILEPGDDMKIPQETPVLEPGEDMKYPQETPMLAPDSSAWKYDPATQVTPLIEPPKPQGEGAAPGEAQYIAQLVSAPTVTNPNQKEATLMDGTVVEFNLDKTLDISLSQVVGDEYEGATTVIIDTKPVDISEYVMISNGENVDLNMFRGDLVKVNQDQGTQLTELKDLIGSDGILRLIIGTHVINLRVEDTQA